jgi:hypothetical protein
MVTEALGLDHPIGDDGPPLANRIPASDREISAALALVADGKTLREAGAAVGAPHTTVMRWLRKAA